MIEKNVYSAPQSSLSLPESKRGKFTIFARILTVPYFIIWTATILRAFIKVITAEASNFPNLLGSLTGVILVLVITIYPLAAFWRVSGVVQKAGRVGALKVNAGAGILVFALFAALALFVPTNNSIVFWLSAVLLSLPYMINVIAVLKLK